MTKINPYYVVKQAKLVNSRGYLNTDIPFFSEVHTSDTIAPILGMLLGGGYGAYKGKSLGGKILKGLAGAGIGGLAGMGINHILDRTWQSNYMNMISNIASGQSDIINNAIEAHPEDTKIQSDWEALKAPYLSEE